MNNKDISPVITACEKIASSGRKPCTASIRYSLPTGFPFPLIVTGLKYWENLQRTKANKNTPTIEKTKNMEKTEADTVLSAFQESLSAEGGFTNITDISNKLTLSEMEADFSKESCNRSINEATITSKNTVTEKIKSSKKNIMTDETFMRLPITEQLLYIKHLLENLNQ